MSTSRRPYCILGCSPLDDDFIQCQYRYFESFSEVVMFADHVCAYSVVMRQMSNFFKRVRLAKLLEKNMM